MKKLLIILGFIIIGFSTSCCFAENWDELYEAAEPFPSRLYNDIDPYEDEDNIKYAWSPYPLFRTSAYLYFKEFVIEPGYYTITPRTLKGKDYILFKQGGRVRFIIPVAKKEATPLNFYEANTPKVKLTKMQKFAAGVRKIFYDTAKDSMRGTPPSSLVNVEVEVTYVILTLFYGEDKYIALFKRTPY